MAHTPGSRKRSLLTSAAGGERTLASSLDKLELIAIMVVGAGAEMIDETEPKGEQLDEPWRSLTAFFGGRCGRLEYWIWIAILLLAGGMLAYVHVLNLGVAFALKLGVVALQVRRLHDVGRSGLWASLFLIAPVIVSRVVDYGWSHSLANPVGTLVGVCIMVLIGGLQGQRGANRFGAPPPNHFRSIIFK